MSFISAILAKRSQANGDKVTTDRSGRGASTARASMLSYWDDTHVYVPFDAANVRDMGEQSTAQGRSIGAGARFYCVAEFTGKPCSKGRAHETTCGIDPNRFGGASPNEFHEYGCNNGGHHSHLRDAVREMARSTTKAYRPRRLLHWSDEDAETQYELIREYAPAALLQMFPASAPALPAAPAIEAPKPATVKAPATK